jgi:hypothetical protein
VVVATGGHSSAPSARGADSALLASTRGEASGRRVDGVRCETGEQALFHIHAHLAVFVDGRRGVVPQGIGIPPPRQQQRTADGPFVTGGACFYWLHSHTADGIIHIESPVRRTYTLGDYFDIWTQPLSSARVGPARGRVTAYVRAPSNQWPACAMGIMVMVMTGRRRRAGHAEVGVAHHDGEHPVLGAGGVADPAVDPGRAVWASVSPG